MKTYIVRLGIFIFCLVPLLFMAAEKATIVGVCMLLLWSCTITWLFGSTLGQMVYLRGQFADLRRDYCKEVAGRLEKQIEFKFADTFVTNHVVTIYPKNDEWINCKIGDEEIMINITYNQLREDTNLALENAYEEFLKKREKIR